MPAPGAWPKAVGYRNSGITSRANNSTPAVLGKSAKRRMSRKVNAFSKDPDYLEHQLTLAFADYHFGIPHRGLRQRLQLDQPTNGPKGSRKKWKPVTPAMAAGLTDHVGTMDELLSFRIPPSPRA